eukprot:GHVQ01004303.1.p1 GENE.GHVQ01004303.1~~GHVQ01004303.1.p1  ORF type:complete len:545 (-),score=77.34 GHVQ01004303.1:62-1696(-)
MATAAVDCPRPITSAASVLSLLEEPERQLQVFALDKLNEVVELYWPEIADSLTEIEKLYEDETFSHRELAALVASKVYYHLEEYTEALRYALGAGELFDMSDRSQYVDTIVAKCIDQYISKRDQIYESQPRQRTEHADESAAMEQEVVIDPRLESIVERMLDICRKGGDETQALGVAFDARRLDKVEEIICGSSDLTFMLQHCMKNAQSLISSKRFRSEVVDLLVTIYRQFPEDKLEAVYPHLCQCLFHQGDAHSVAKILKKLLCKNEDSDLIAHQIAFDIVDLENQTFLNELLNREELQPVLDLAKNDSESDPSEKKKECEDDERQPLISSTEAAADSDANKPGPAELSTDPPESEEARNLRTLRYILSGKASIELQLQFMHRNNHSDLILLDQIKNSVDQRSSIIHHGIVTAHGLMQAGTTSSAFLRPNLDWFSKSVNWAKFSAAASLGVIHKGHIKESTVVLGAYLPKASGERGSPYSEGGALYALGLINANHSDESVKEYLLSQLRGASSDETLQHGACLGLGLLCMGRSDSSKRRTASV